MTDKQTVAREMRENGATYTEIGQRLGVSRQRAHTLSRGRQTSAQTLERLRYPALGRWLYDHDMTISGLARKISISPAALYKNVCVRGTAEPRKGTIDKLLKATGMTYEQMFSEERE